MIDDLYVPMGFDGTIDTLLVGVRDYQLVTLIELIGLPRAHEYRILDRAKKLGLVSDSHGKDYELIYAEGATFGSLVRQALIDEYGAEKARYYIERAERRVAYNALLIQSVREALEPDFQMLDHGVDDSLKSALLDT